MKQVQISKDLFLLLIKYHIFECYNEEEKIVEELQNFMSKERGVKNGPD